MVGVVERGTADDFIMKAKERICGRAQLEIQNNTIDTMNKFLYSDINCIKDPIIKDQFVKFSAISVNTTTADSIAPYYVPASRCMCKYGVCTEHCAWYKRCIGRLI